MQSGPSETSNPVPDNSTSEEPNASQYGSQPDGLRPDERLSGRQGGTGASTSPADVSPLSVSSDDSFEEFGARLSSTRAKTHKSTAQRIADYENALSPSPPRKYSEGPGLIVVKSKNSKQDGLQLNDFPNGNSAPSLLLVELR